MAKDTINIYLTKDERKQLDIIKSKYQLSLTTITDILCFETYHTFIQLGNEEQIRKLTEEYIYKNGAKTSIKKPNVMKSNGIFKDTKKKSRFATNVLKIYLYKDIKNYTEDKELISSFYNKVNEKMTKTQDQYWNYNNYLRNFMRTLKDNKNYIQENIDRINGKSKN